MPSSTITAFSIQGSNKGITKELLWETRFRLASFYNKNSRSEFFLFSPLAAVALFLPFVPRTTAISTAKLEC
jgi:hypothetical protein